MVGVLVLLPIVAVSVVTVKKRNIKIPGLDAVRGLVNPGYSKFDDGGMVNISFMILTNIEYFLLQVSLKELSSKENDA